MTQQKDCEENKRIETAIERIIEYLFNYTPNLKRTLVKNRTYGKVLGKDRDFL